MGYMRHHAIVVCSWDKKYVKRAREKAQEIGATVTGIVASPVNGYHSFLVAPDGSKEGWGDSDVGDEQRRIFVDWLDTQRWGDGSGPCAWAEVMFGDENGAAAIESHSGEPMREKAGELE